MPVTGPDLRERAMAVKAALNDPRQLGIDARPSAGGWSAPHGDHGHRTHCMSIQSGNLGLKFKCFSCNFRGDVLDYIANLSGIGTTEGRQFLAVIEQAERLASITPPLPKRKPGPDRPRGDLEAHARAAIILAEIAPWRDQIDAVRFIESRGFDLDEIPASFFCLPSAKEQQRRIARELARRIGRDGWLASGLAAKDGEGFVWPDHRLGIVWHGWSLLSSPSMIQRRLLVPRDSQPKYVSPSNFRPAAPFGAADLAEDLDPDRSEVWIVEGALDVLALRVLARENESLRHVLPLGLAGVQGWNSEWASRLRGLRVGIAFDADLSEITAKNVARSVKNIAADLREQGCVVERIKAPQDGMDWADELKMWRRG